MAIKTLQNNFTTPEQSKRMLKLGVPVWTADGLQTYRGIKVLEEPQYDNPNPCWSVGRLIEIMKECSIPVTTWYIKSDSKKPLLEYFMDDLDSALMERDMDFSKLEE